jgi:hypothetical protein
MEQTVRYRIYDQTDQHILASEIPTLEKAQELLGILLKDFPTNELEIESYSKKL